MASSKVKDDIAALLQMRRDAGNNLIHPVPMETDTSKTPEHLKAVQGATLDDFIDMIAKLSSKIFKKDKVEFCPDEGARLKVDMAEKLDHPVIYFSVKSRVPKTERKPRQRESILETSADKSTNRQGQIWGQKFACIVQFNILAGDYRTANKVMNVFEELIFNYTSYFKENGVAEILFEKHFTDTNLDPYRQHISVRSLQYYVEVEKLFAEFTDSIDGISVI